MLCTGQVGAYLASVAEAYRLDHETPGQRAEKLCGRLNNQLGSLWKEPAGGFGAVHAAKFCEISVILRLSSDSTSPKATLARLSCRAAVSPTSHPHSTTLDGRSAQAIPSFERLMSIRKTSGEAEGPSK